MVIRDKKVLVIGLGISGVQTAKVLYSLGARVIVNDRRKEKELKGAVRSLKDMDIGYVLGEHPIKLASWPDFAVISPGVPMDTPMVRSIQGSGREVISEIELAQRLTDTPIVAITGTNGKTTTTVLTGEIFRLSGIKTYVAGNIGTPIIKTATTSKGEDILVAEISSFQLEGIEHFRPKAAAVLNITPDHLDRHRTFNNYVHIKARIFENQGPEDFTVLNADNSTVSALADKCRSKVVFFSRRKTLDSGVFTENGYLILKKGNTVRKVCPVADLKIPGDHNLENALAATALAWCMDVPAEIIARALTNFDGVEHRLEYVDCIKGVKFINDSKGTNPDASSNAIKALEGPIVIIVGGYDKGGDYDEFVQGFGDKIKGIVLMGATADKLKKSCQRADLNNMYVVKDMQGAVNKAASLAEKGDTVLLSPACASWDMYESFEERGEEFKKHVGALRRLS